MNEMYNISLAIHSLATVALLAVVFINLFLLISQRDLPKYKRLMSIFLTPLTLTTFGFVFFTGVIMMAAKHLDFTIFNILMVLISIAYIVLEVKRLKGLKYLNAQKERAFDAYKPFARRLLQIEFLMVLLVALLMWFA